MMNAYIITNLVFNALGILLYSAYLHNGCYPRMRESVSAFTDALCLVSSIGFLTWGLILLFL